MLFDPQKVPFSYHESFLCISWLEDAFWLRSVRGGDEHTDLGRLLRLEVLQDGQPCEPKWSLAPEVLTATTAAGTLGLAFDGPNRIVLSAQGLGLRLATLRVHLLVVQAGTIDLDDELLAHCIDHADTHTVQAAGHLVPLTTELAAGV